jgi:hypothetical protein
MIDREELIKHPLVLIIADLEAGIMSAKQSQKMLIKLLAKELNCLEETLLNIIGWAFDD